MNLLPSENITYRTKLSTDEVKQRLADSIEPPKWLGRGLEVNKDTKPYYGKLNCEYFDVMRAIKYRNSFLPQIKGNLQPEPGGTVINVKMQMHSFIISFMYLWCGALLLVSVALLKDSIKTGKFNEAIVLPLGMLFMCYLLVIFGFKGESSQAKGDLKKLFEAEIME